MTPQQRISETDRAAFHSFLSTVPPVSLRSILKTFPPPHGYRNARDTDKKRLKLLANELTNPAALLHETDSHWKLYSLIWEVIADKASTNSWPHSKKSDTNTDLVQTFLARVISERLMAREDIEELLQYAPFEISESHLEKVRTVYSRREVQLENDLKKDHLDIEALQRDILDISQSLKNIREEMLPSQNSIKNEEEKNIHFNIHDGRLSALESALINTERGNQNNQKLNDALVRIEKFEYDVISTLKAIDDAKKKDDVSIDVDSRLSEMSKNITQIRNLIGNEDIHIFKNEFSLAMNRIARIEETSANTMSLNVIAPTSYRDSQTIITEILPIITRNDLIHAIIESLRSIGILSQSASQAALEIATGIIATRWINIEGSLAYEAAESIAKSLSSRGWQRIDIPVGCLDAFRTNATRGLYVVVGANRAPIEIYGGDLRAASTRRVRGKANANDPLVLAVHSAGPSCISVIAQANELGPYINVDTLCWGKPSGDAPSRELSPEVMALEQTTLIDDETDVAYEKLSNASQLWKLSYRRYCAELLEFSKDERAIEEASVCAYRIPRAIAIESGKKAAELLGDLTKNNRAKLTLSAAMQVHA